MESRFWGDKTSPKMHTENISWWIWYNPFQKKKKGWVSSFASFKNLTVIKCFVKPFLCTMKHRMWVDCQTHVGSERMDAKRIFCFRQVWLEMMVIISKSSFMNRKLAIFFLFWRKLSLAPPSVGHYMTNQKAMHYHIGINLHALISWHISSFFQIRFHWSLSFSTPSQPQLPSPRVILLQQQHLSWQALSVRSSRYAASHSFMTALYWFYVNCAQSESSSYAYITIYTKTYDLIHIYIYRPSFSYIFRVDTPRVPRDQHRGVSG